MKYYLKDSVNNCFDLFLTEFSFPKYIWVSGKGFPVGHATTNNFFKSKSS